MTDHARDAMELKLTLRRIEAAEAALADARRSLTDLVARQTAPAPAPTPTLSPVPLGPPPPPAAATYPVPPTPPKLMAPAKPPVPTETKVIRAVAVAGSLITVAGVGLAVALAIQAGLLGPLGRVLLSSLLAAGLLAAGLWLDRSRHRAAAGVTALVVTSWLVSTVILWALLNILRWWPDWLAVTVLLAVWLALLAITAARGLTTVALIMTLSTILIVPAFYGAHIPTTWLLMFLPLSLLVFHPRHGLVRAVAAVMAALLQGWVVTDILAVYADATSATALTVAVIGLVSALLFAAVGLRFPAADERTDVITVFLAPLGLLALSAPAAAGTWAIWLLVPATVGLAWLGYRHNHLLGVVGVCATAVAFVLVWWLTPPFGAGPLIDATIVVALFFIGAILAVIWLDAQEESRVWPWAFWLGAALIVTFTLSRNVLTKSPLWLTDHIALVQAALIAVFLGVILTHRRPLAAMPVRVQVALAVVGLHLSMVTVVTAATWLGNIIAATHGMWLGYLIGHAAVSVLWMVLAAWILLAAPGLSDRASLGSGMVLAVAGVVKLVFFDLGALEGLPRALAFLASGIALLAMASLRARRREDQSTSDRN
ncbi:MAG: hypothetical protein Q4G50_02930 [Corynebacterium sp.]|uniref:hypothetical protein n=1 Tax=Corynebacterium sp. TaxID=1720 RepID=UPI0026DFDD71|nr:hypothetical protein [Corynebacterium sp.]MDO5668938.1 hypothetical protein [Corynebacterium sp.]